MLQQSFRLAFVLAGVLVATACAGGSSPPVATTSPTGVPSETAAAPTEAPATPDSETATSTAVPSPTETSIPAQEGTHQTGISVVDAIIEAVLAGDSDRLASMLVMRECVDSIACDRIPLEDRAETFPSTACAGYFSPADEARETVRTQWSADGPSFTDLALHAVYLTNHRPFDVEAEYAVVFSHVTADGVTAYRELLTGGDAIVLVNWGCGGELPNPDLVESWVIEPAP
ncbi:MAG: hypothetical protein GEU75_13375 [Dehalococcoidia bacterium]|nr:hypothetical protein [Dehalococcoidia bacterium]